MARRAPEEKGARGDHHAVRDRIVAAGASLLSKGGREALTTRAVAKLAHVQAPTIYRLFGDKDGLLEAVAKHVMQRYVDDKEAGVLRDPLEDLRRGWDLNIAFSLAHPAIFAIMSADPRPDHVSPAAAAGHAVLTAKLERLGQRGLLSVTVERAVNLVRAAGTGTTLMLLGMREDKVDLGLSEAAREAVIAAILRRAPAVKQSSTAGAAIALRASIARANVTLTPGERTLLIELLDRLSKV